MFYSIATSESLTNPVILNEYRKRNVIVDSAPLSEQPFWHIFVIEVDDKHADQFAGDFSKLIKQGWYLVLWNDKEVYVVLQNKVFKLKREKTWSSGDYEEMRRYAMANGIAEEYLDFNVNFPEYERLVKS